MKLVDDIIAQASDGKQSLPDVLRKCLILAFELKNDKLKIWVERELNGHKDDDDVPEYRIITAHSVGNFIGPGGGWIPNRPLPTAVLSAPHRKLLESGSRFKGPIAAYDQSGKGEGDRAILNWPPDLIAMYQGKFIRGYALSHAWQEVPTSSLLALFEEVRNRVLRFALEIREELGETHDKPSDLPPQKVEAAVVNYILGGTNIIAGTATGISQIGSVVVARGDFNGLSDALRQLDTTEEEIEALADAIGADKQTFGSRTKAWLANVSGKIGKAGLDMGAALAEELAKRWLTQYFHLDT